MHSMARATRCTKGADTNATAIVFCRTQMLAAALAPTRAQEAPLEANGTRKASRLTCDP